MTTYGTTTRPNRPLVWLLAGFAAQGLLPWLLSRAAKSAGARDLVDCHEAARSAAAR
jgi:hypothetical protein